MQLEAQFTGWQTVKNSENHWLFGLDFVNATTGWAVGDSGTIVKTIDGGFSWLPQNSGTFETFNAVNFINSTTGWAVGDNEGRIVKTTNGGASWSMEDSGHALTAIQFLNADTGWAVGANGLVLNTTDGCATWNQQVISGVNAYLTTVFFITKTTGWITGDFPGTIVKTTDGGLTWTDQSSGIDPNEDVEDIFFTDQQTGWLVGFNFPDTVGIGVIEKTTDGGSSWVNQTSGTSEFLLSLGFVNQNDGWVVGGNGVIVRTTNAGGTWFGDSSGTTDELDKIVVRRGEGGWVSGGKILRATSSPLPVQVASLSAAVVGTSNIQLQWTTVSEINNYGFIIQCRPDSAVSFEDIPSSFTPGYGTTLEPQHYSYTQANVNPGHYFYRLKQIDFDGLISYSSSVEVNVSSLTGVSEGISPAFSLSQNYPNPFNPSTSIKYQLAVESRVSLKVYDILGQEVKTLVDEVQSAGYKSIDWHTENESGIKLSSGCYIYRIHATSVSNSKEFMETKMMVLIK